MKKILYLIIAVLVFCSCQNEDSAFKTDVQQEAFSFKAIPGGAVMHYKLPYNPEISGLKVRYTSPSGEELVRTSSMLTDSVMLIGFNEAMQHVAASVTLLKVNQEESEPIDVFFDTLDNGAITFLKEVQIKSGWDGFHVEFNNPAHTSGMAHFYYLGVNPQNNQPDTVLIESVLLTPGADTLIYKLEQSSPNHTVIIRTEDFYNPVVNERVWKNVAAYNTAKLEAGKLDFYYDFSVEDESASLGAKYLFDGDTKGESWMALKDPARYFTFLAGPQALDEPMYIDIRDSKLISELRFYCMLNIWHPMDEGFYGRYVFKGLYEILLASSITVYVAKDDASGASSWENKEWVKLNSYYDDPRPKYDDNRWCKHHNGSWYNTYETVEELKKATPAFLSIPFPVVGQDEGYRYLKIVVHETYLNDSGYAFNTERYFSFHELEIYTNQD